MKKRLFLITLITALLFTMCGLTALAEDETLAISAYYATEACIELETNLAVTVAPTAEITDRSTGETKSASVMLENDNKRIRIAIADGEFDLSKSYIVIVTGITDGTDTISFEKIISFDVLFRDDFESYEDTNAMLQKWFKFVSAGNEQPATEDYAELDTKDGNKRLALKKELILPNGNDTFLINKDAETLASEFDSYVLSYDTENTRNGQLISTVNNGDKYLDRYGSVIFGQDINSKEAQTRIFADDVFKWYNGAGTVLSELANEKKTVTEISNRMGEDKDELRIYYDGILKWQVPENLKFKYGGVCGTFGFSSGMRNNSDPSNYVYIDNIRAYKPVWREASDILSIASVYATEGCVEIEVNKALTQAPSVTVKDSASNTFKTADVTLENSNKRIRIALTNGEKFDLDDSYVINAFAITDGTDTLSFNKVLSFDVLFKDDFESYNTNDELYVKWHRMTGNGQDIDALSDSNFYDATFSDYVALDKNNGNNRLVLKKKAQKGGQWLFLVNNDAELNGNAYDSYVLSYDVEQARAAGLTTAINNRYKVSGSVGTTTFQWDPTTHAFQNRIIASSGVQIWAGDGLQDITNGKHTITEISNRTGGDKDELRIYSDSSLKWQVPEDKEFKYGGDFGTFGFANGQSNNTDSQKYVYLDNIRAYKPVWTMPTTEDILVTDSMISAKLINITYTNKVTEASAKNLISLTANGEAVETSVTLSKDGKTVSVKPASPLTEGKLYVLTSNGVSDMSGNASPLYTKKFIIEDILNDNFDSYAQTSELDKKYTVMPTQSYPVTEVTQQKPSENLGVSLQNGKLKLTSELGLKNVFTIFEKYPTRNEWDKDYIFEADIERISAKDGLAVYFHTSYASASTGLYDGSNFIKLYTENNEARMRNRLHGFTENKEWLPTEGMAERSMMFRVDGNTLSVYNNDSLLLQNSSNPLNVGTGEFAFQLENSEYLIDNIRAYKVREITDNELKLELFDARQLDNGVGAKISVANNTGSAIENALLFVGFYDSDNKLIGTNIINIANLENEKAQVYNPEIVSEVKYRYARAFLWNGGMKPLADSSVLE